MIELKVLRRNLKGEPILGNYMEFCSESAEEVSDWYEKTVVFARKGKRHNKKVVKKEGGDV